MWVRNYITWHILYIMYIPNAMIWLTVSLALRQHSITHCKSKFKHSHSWLQTFPEQVCAIFTSVIHFIVYLAIIFGKIELKKVEFQVGWNFQSWSWNVWFIPQSCLQFYFIYRHEMFSLMYCLKMITLF